jgi:pimeloyl-ACP methyl ester carboxylesterase
VELAYDEAGQGAPPMLFVHGWTCDRTYFAPQFEHFGRNHRVVAVDLRGHGASEAPEGDYGIPVLADDVALTAAKLDLHGAVAVGHSMGAAVVVQLAARYPELVSALVLVDAAPLGTLEEQAALFGPIAENLSGADVGAVRRSFVEGALFLPTDDPALKARVVGEMLRPPDHVARACMRGMGAWDGAAALRAVRAPVLAIHADQAINQPEKLEALSPALRNARTAGVGHFNQLLAPEEVNRLIEEFIA